MNILVICVLQTKYGMNRKIKSLWKMKNEKRLFKKTVTAFYEKEDLLAKESQPTKTLEEILKGAKNQTINKKRRKAK